jgi:hypothetical protein
MISSHQLVDKLMPLQVPIRLGIKRCTVQESSLEPSGVSKYLCVIILLHTLHGERKPRSAYLSNAWRVNYIFRSTSKDLLWCGTQILEKRVNKH